MKAVVTLDETRPGRDRVRTYRFEADPVVSVGDLVDVLVDAEAAGTPTTARVSCRPERWGRTPGLELSFRFPLAGPRPRRSSALRQRMLLRRRGSSRAWTVTLDRVERSTRRTRRYEVSPPSAFSLDAFHAILHDAQSEGADLTAAVRITTGRRSRAPVVTVDVMWAVGPAG